MAFTIGSIAGKDGAGTAITGGLLAADTVGGGAGPWFLFHSLVDGVAGVNKMKIRTTAPASGDPAIVVALSPDGLNANGQAIMASSSPSVIASDQTTLAFAHDVSALQNGAAGASAKLTPKFASVSLAASGALVTAVSAKKILLHSAILVAAGTVTATFKDGSAGTALSGAIPLIANVGFVLPFSPVGWTKGLTNTTDLYLTLSASIGVTGLITYTEV